MKTTTGIVAKIDIIKQPVVARFHVH